MVFGGVWTSSCCTALFRRVTQTPGVCVVICRARPKIQGVYRKGVKCTRGYLFRWMAPK